MCQNGRIVVDWSGQSDIIMLFQHFDAIIYPTACFKYNIISALIKVITSIVVGLLEQYIPHFSKMTLLNVCVMNEFEIYILENV
ncbi:MAG: hypothetical protein CMJ41_10630 [Phycisphaerae bacterium]|nr:hypothetical protein [Phycisphaerae bacterium]